jgi:hypothetical protein
LKELLYCLLSVTHTCLLDVLSKTSGWRCTHSFAPCDTWTSIQKPILQRPQASSSCNSRVAQAKYTPVLLKPCRETMPTLRRIPTWVLRVETAKARDATTTPTTAPGANAHGDDIGPIALTVETASLPSVFLDTSHFNDTTTPRAKTVVSKTSTAWFSIMSPSSFRGSEAPGRTSRQGQGVARASPMSKLKSSVNHGLRSLPEHSGSQKRRWGRKQRDKGARNQQRGGEQAKAALQWPSQVDPRKRSALWLQVLGLEASTQGMDEATGKQENQPHAHSHVKLNGFASFLDTLELELALG